MVVYTIINANRLESPLNVLQAYVHFIGLKNYCQYLFYQYMYILSGEILIPILPYYNIYTGEIFFLVLPFYNISLSLFQYNNNITMKWLQSIIMITRMLPCPCGAIDWNIYIHHYMPICRLYSSYRLKTAIYVYL